MSRLGGAGLTLVAVLVIGVALVGLIWGAIFSVTALLGVTIAVGIVARQLVGERAPIQVVLASGAVGSVAATVFVPMLGLPVLIRFAGIPVLWAIIGAMAATAIASTLTVSRSVPR